MHESSRLARDLITHIRTIYESSLIYAHKHTLQQNNCVAECFAKCVDCFFSFFTSSGQCTTNLPKCCEGGPKTCFGDDFRALGSEIEENEVLTWVPKLGKDMPCGKFTYEMVIIFLFQKFTNDFQNMSKSPKKVTVVVLDLFWT